MPGSEVEMGNSGQDERRRRLDRVLAMLGQLRERVEQLCGVVEQADKIFSFGEDMRGFLGDADAQELLPYRARKSLLRAADWLNRAKKKVAPAKDACHRIRKVLDYADKVASGVDPESLSEPWVQKALDRTLEVADKLVPGGVTPVKAVIAVALVGAVFGGTFLAVMSDGPPADGEGPGLGPTPTAPFIPVQHTLTVSCSGSGSVSPQQCRSTVPYAAGTVVTLTASPASGWLFLAWSGDCTGTGPCQLTMTSNKSVTATFQQRFSLTVACAGSGTVSPQQCRSTVPYAAGTVVTLTASPAPGSDFSGWSGACSGPNPCVVTMNSDKSVTARFSGIP